MNGQGHDRLWKIRISPEGMKLYEVPENILENMLTVNTALHIFKCAEMKSDSNDVLFTTETKQV